MPRGKIDMAGQEETKVTPLEKELPDRKVTISSELSKAEEEELMETLVKTKTSSPGQPPTSRESAGTSYRMNWISMKT